MSLFLRDGVFAAAGKLQQLGLGRREQRVELNDLEWRARNNAAESVKEEDPRPGAARSPLGAQWALRYILHYYTNNTRECELQLSHFTQCRVNFHPSQRREYCSRGFLRRHRRYLFWLEKSSSSRPRGHFSHWQNRLLRKLPRITIYPLPPALGNPLFLLQIDFCTPDCAFIVFQDQDQIFFHVAFGCNKGKAMLEKYWNFISDTFLWMKICIEYNYINEFNPKICSSLISMEMLPFLKIFTTGHLS